MTPILPAAAAPAPDTSPAASLRPDWARVDHVLLDMDGTLLDLAYDNWFWRTHLPETYQAHHGVDAATAAARLEPEFARVAHTLPWYCTDHWSRVTALPIAAMKQASRDRVRFLPGIPAWLAGLGAAGLTPWIATNAHPDAWRPKLAATGLGDLVGRVISSHDYGAEKESPLFWARLVADTGVALPRALFVDDSPRVLAAAKLAGVGQVVAVRWPDRSVAIREDALYAGFGVVDSVTDIALPAPAPGVA